MNVFKKVLFLSLFFAGLNGTCFMTEPVSPEDIDITEVRIQLEEQLAMLQLGSKGLPEEEAGQIEEEKLKLIKAIDTLRELEDKRGLAEYWDDVRAKAKKSTAVAVVLGAVAAGIGGFLLYKGISWLYQLKKENEEFKADRDALEAKTKALREKIVSDELELEEKEEAIAAFSNEILRANQAKEAVTKYEDLLRIFPNAKEIAEISKKPEDERTNKEKKKLKKFEEKLKAADDKAARIAEKEEKKRLKQEEKAKKKEEAERAELAELKEKKEKVEEGGGRFKKKNQKRLAKLIEKYEKEEVEETPGV